MDLVAEQLYRELTQRHADRFDTKMNCARWSSRITTLLGSGGTARNLERLYNRLVIYPRHVKRTARDFDLFHLADHSYSQLLHALPADRTGIFCHDLDTFRCLLEPAVEPRPRWFRGMAQRILNGFRKAAVVFYSTEEIRRQILMHSLIDPTKLVQAPLGTAEEFTANPPPQPVIIPGIEPDQPFILHVGSCIPRKRIDVLLDVFAQIRTAHPALRLLKIGGQWTSQQQQQIDRLGIGSAISAIGFQSREVVAESYRRAQAVLVPSEAEGFGLPVIEALACGGVVLASEIPVLREVGAHAINYARVGDVAGWTAALDTILRGQSLATREQRLTRAELFSWRHHAQVIADTYAALLEGNTSTR